MSCDVVTCFSVDSSVIDFCVTVNTVFATFIDELA